MRLAALDIETTGLNPTLHQALSAGICIGEERANGELAILTEGEVRFAYQGGPVDPEAMSVNQIDLSTWAGGDQSAGLRWIAQLLERAEWIFVHGATFDWGFLLPAMIEAGIDPCRAGARGLLRRTFDTRTLALPLKAAGLLKSTSLVDLCNFLGVSNDGAHGATVDARRCLEVGARAMALYRGRLGLAGSPELQAQF